MRKPWHGGDKAPLAEPYSGPGSTVDFDADSVWHCARIMQPYLPEEKLFPPSDEAPPSRFRFHRWRYDMAEKFRVALAAKGQIVAPPDAVDLPKETASGEEIWAHSPYNPRSVPQSIPSTPEPEPAPAPPPAVPAVSASRSWTLPLAGVGVLVAGILAWFRLRR